MINPTPSREPIFEKGDNVILTETDEMGIVYQGPDVQGRYIVQVRQEKEP